ncbi:hypothetical protein CLAFUW4_01575 [Fulvia fulva]|uniref:TRIP4/RQT4 C2HC5-type zinc finger domain-containing protein n=1 Tax=Passalora fulva TaxID=5499 RepID=A0A9Q8L7P2_PASFU|nr:uncharacterized protein CLAFUR5_01575 [Fulvia fulva]KAK4635901.1 hypothetical protein CLAFUR4_01574 [Fulvia fulva]KAK4637037.1 hypothetical protein CLAFUR0_01575 [Fulvia fulva]UJO12334.1 hypothetical protein CLAFUR5_01575 [Fulvia fulva]WPV08492.1 hypothetical protein CLAFUW4_01575 [Fulvia fulva]WPV24913.1 hypothetical protein CLAFUW7_01578 [Fulvia fulva]
MASIEAWALPRLQQLLPLDDESLKQVIGYADSLSKDAAAEHLKNLLGDDARSLEFISTFNLRRQNAPAQAPGQATGTTSSTAAAATPDTPKRSRPQKKRANIHSLPARQLEGHGDTSGAYQKRHEQDYMAASFRQRHKDQVAGNLALQRKPDATQMPLITDDAAPTSAPITSKPPPSASGPLISDALSTKRSGSTRESTASSRNASPSPRTKINIAGGTAMHGASTALSDLDSAIRALEVQINPGLSAGSAAETERRKCNCMATRHPLLDMAPNCLQCGKVICVKEGLGPCTFCGAQLMGAEELQKVLRVLRDERGEARMKANNAGHKKADVAQGKARAFTGRDFLAQASSSRSSPLSSQPSTPAGSDDEASAKAKDHRDRLLGFQANNARRTRVHDEAADYDVPTAGTNMWASPQDRAMQLKKQQKILREMEWNAKPEYEKRRVVASIDLKGGKIVRKMAEVEKPDFGNDDEAEVEEHHQSAPSGQGGAFSHNPLASGLIRPVAREGKGKDTVRENRNTWRRVQMDEDDNEQWILDGGVYGGQATDRPLGDEEHAQG